MIFINNQNCSILLDEFQSRIFVLQGLDFCKDSLINFIKSRIIPLTIDQDYYLSLKIFTNQILEQIHD